jgi:peptide/nickel transport system substrate-binding protein
VKKGLFVLFAIAILASLVLAGCGQSTTTTPASTTTASATAPAKPVSGGVLRYGLNQEYPCIGDPISSNMYSSGAIVLDISLETLLNLDGTGQPVPWLATDWVMDNAALTMTLTLRQGVKFHDGTDFNATAAKWNLDRAITAKKSEMGAVKSVDAVDANTIRLNLSRQDGLLPVYLATLRGVMISPAAFEKAGTTDKERSTWAEQNPVGTGPFYMVSRVRDVKTVFKKNVNYWQPGKPYLDEVDFLINADEATLLAEFKAGNLDVMLTQQFQNIKLLDDTGKYQIPPADVRTIGGLEGDSKHPDSPWAKLKVRQAAAHAIDTVQYANTLGYGYWKATNQFDMLNRWGYNPDVVGYDYNIAKAKQLLAEAGYPNGFTTNIYGMPSETTMVTAAQGYLKEIGITANAQIVTPEKRVQMFSSAGWEGAWIWECSVEPSSLANMARNFTAASAPTRMVSVDVPAELSALVTEATSKTDFAEQQKLTWQIQKDLTDKYALITMMFGEYIPTPMTKQVQNLKVNTILHFSPADWWLKK